MSRQEERKDGKRRGNKSGKFNQLSLFYSFSVAASMCLFLCRRRTLKTFTFKSGVEMLSQGAM